MTFRRVDAFDFFTGPILGSSSYSALRLALAAAVALCPRHL
jgi:hypothetical protein